MPGLLRLQRRRRVERACARAVAAHRHHPAPPARQTRQNPRRRIKLSYAKIAEFQRRGAVHFHAIFRLDGLDPVHPERTVPPHPALTADLLADLIRQVTAAAAWFATVPHPIKPNGWDITWGAPG